MWEIYFDHVTTKISNFSPGLYFFLMFGQLIVNKLMKIKQSYLETLNNWLSNLVNIIFLTFFIKSLNPPFLEYRFNDLANFLNENKVFTILIVILMQDFVFYWTHRLCHSHPVLWAFHEPHHTSEELNLSTAARVPWFLPIFQNLLLWPVTMFFLMLGISGDILITAGQIAVFYVFYTHCGYMIHNKYLAKILITPHAHAIHHERKFQSQTSNYGSIFSIFDRFYGTYNTSKCSQVYGCDGLVYKTSNFFYVQLYPFIVLTKSLLKIKGAKNKIKFLVLGRV